MAKMITDTRPGLSALRLSRLVTEAVERCELDLSGARVLTEAATGAYVVTPVIAAVAGAEVVAITSSSRYGTVQQVSDATRELAGVLGVADQITVTEQRTAELFASADVITNSGHVRPVSGELAEAISSRAVMPLMFETWEVGSGRVDVDLDLLVAKGVRIAGTNERHRHVDVFSFLGPMAVAQLGDAGVSAYLGRIDVLCDNPFADYLLGGLKSAGADVRVSAALGELLSGRIPDALVVALRPTGAPVLSEADLEQIASRWPQVVVTQFWGDLDREACTCAQVRCWPPGSPGLGHMGVLPSRVGPEPIVRLQAGGFKVAQVLLKHPAVRTAADLEYLDAY